MVMRQDASSKRSEENEMKKIVTKPDGTKEEIEGSAEELAAYERKLKESVVQEKKTPGLLTDELRRLDWQSPHEYHNYTHSEQCPITIAARGHWFSVTPAMCTCGADLSFVVYPYTFTSTYTYPPSGSLIASFGLPVATNGDSTTSDFVGYNYN
jgi:hypothetical protein